MTLLVMLTVLERNPKSMKLCAGQVDHVPGVPVVVQM